MLKLNKFAVFLSDKGLKCIINLTELLGELRIVKVLDSKLPIEFFYDQFQYNVYSKENGVTEFIVLSDCSKNYLQKKLQESFELRNLVRLGGLKYVRD